MATEYTITYTYTGQSNTSRARSVGFSHFSVSGDTDRRIGQITSITYEHYHTSTNSMTWNLRGRLVFADGSAIDSENVGNHISGNVVKYVNTFSTLPSAEQFATLSYVQTLDSNGSTGDSGYYATLYWRANSTYPMKVIVTFIEEPPVVYAPAIESFSLQRCNESAMPDDEGIYIATSLKLAIGDAAGLDGAQMRIYYAANAYPIVGESQYVDLSGRISELLSGVETNTGILTGAWNVGNTWYFAAVFTAGEETAIATGFIARGSTSFHISDEPGGGAAVGGFSRGTTDEPKFESYPPAYLYGGIAGLGEGNCEMSRHALGIQAGKAVPGEVRGNSYQDVVVTFPVPFASEPIVVVGFWSGSTAANHGSFCTAAYTTTTTTCVIRTFNATSTSRWPELRWIAVGEM